MYQRQTGATHYNHNNGYFGNLPQQNMGYDTQYNDVSPYSRH